MVTEYFQRDIGRHDEAIETLKDDVKAIRNDLDEIKSLLSESRGGLRVLVAVGSLGGAIGAAVVKFLAMLKGA